MKKNYIIIGVLLLLILVIMGFANFNQQKFYYAYNEKVYLNELDNKVIVRYKQNKKSDNSKISLFSELSNKQVEWKDDSTCVITMDASEKGTFKDRILQQTDVKSCNPVFSINTGLEMGVTDEFLVKFNENVPQTEIEKLHKKYSVEVVKKTDLYQLIKVPNGHDALEIANKYQESGLTRFSHPNFISKVELHQQIPNDPYFANQFSLNNTGQVFTDGHWGANDADIDAPEAWTLTQGSNNIIIAVLDQGLSPDHPDLPNARQIRLNGSNFADGDPNDPSPTANNNHGNGCAGIIGATQNNNQGISGIAPNCRIMPIRIFNTNGSGITADRLSDAINFARNNGADIISNSWGYGIGATNPNLYPVIRDAIVNAITLGRNGLGCIVVFSASNSADHAHNVIGEIRFPANVDVAGVLTVGASDRDDWQANYSPTSNPSSSNNQMIDIVAPSHRAYSCQIAGETFEAWSIDIPGNDGYNPVHSNDCQNSILPGIGTILPNAGVNNLSYTARFGGTSYSCPQVAGVAALMLSINPNLTKQQVFDILTTNADRVGGYVYTNGRSNELGFGRLNANRAVTQTISTITSINGVNTICTSGTYSINNLPLNCSVNWNVTPSGIASLSQSNNIATLSKNSSGNITLTATISTIGANYTQNITISVGKPQISPQTPLAYYSSGLYNSVCNNQTYITDMTISGATNATWTRIAASPSNTSWYQTGNNVSFYFWAVNQTQVFRISSSNTCGTASYDFGFKSITCGIDPCDPVYTIAPNPASDQSTVIINIPAPCDLSTMQSSTFDGYVALYDNQGTLKKKTKYKSYGNIELDLSGLKNGLHHIEIYDGKSIQKKTILIQK